MSKPMSRFAGRLREPRGRLLRTGLMSGVLAVCLAACVPAQVRQAMPRFSRTEASYAGLWYRLLPRWYVLYSILPGEDPSPCTVRSSSESSLGGGLLRVEDCDAGLDAEETARLASSVRSMVNAVQARFQQRIDVKFMRIRLMPPAKHYLGRRSSFLMAHNIKFDIAAKFDASRGGESQRHIVRAAGHELFHMIERALHPWHDDTSEETRAAIFESCLEYDVYKTLPEQVFMPSTQGDPEVLAGLEDARESLAGSVQASKLLARIAGTDFRLSNQPEIAEFEALCDRIVE